jgi:hypothetical protein
LSADSDDEVPILCFPLCSALVSCYGDDEVPILRPSLLAFAPPLSLVLVALNLPLRLVAAADDLSGMGYTDLLLLLYSRALDRRRAMSRVLL